MRRKGFRRLQGFPASIGIAHPRHTAPTDSRQTMIFYFSGTGNSLAVARELAKRLNEPLVEMASSHTVPPYVFPDAQAGVVGFVFPVYAWGMPHVVEDFLKHYFRLFMPKTQTHAPAASPSQSARQNALPSAAETPKPTAARSQTLSHGKPYVFLALTCGDDTGKTPVSFKNTLKERYGLHVDAFWSIQMPNTYISIPGFDVDKESVAKKKIGDAALKTAHIARQIQKRQTGVFDVKVGKFPNIKSHILRPLFNAFLSSPKRFHADASVCTGCKRCVKSCPLANISLQKHTNAPATPQWGANCTMCLACYHSCPHHAISWGAFTKGKGQYWMKRIEQGD